MFVHEIYSAQGRASLTGRRLQVPKARVHGGSALAVLTDKDKVQRGMQLAVYDQLYFTVHCRKNIL